MVLSRSRNFRLLWTGQVISVVGDGMQRIALLWWAATTYGTGTLTALAVSAALPLVVVSPLGGWLADRHDRRHLMLAADAVRLVTTAGLAVLVAGGSPPIGLVLVLVALTACATAAFDPAYGASVPQVVEPDDLAAANGLNMANGALGGIAGPLVGGLLLAAFSPAVVLAVNAATFAWSAGHIALARIPRVSPPVDDTGARRSIVASIGEVVRDPQLGRLIGLGSMLNLVVAPVPLLVVALAVRRFETSSLGFGALQVALSGGLLAGALLAGAVSKVSLRTSMTAVGVLLGVLGVVRYLPALIALAGVGIAVAVANTQMMVAFQTTVPSHRHGQVFGVVGSLSEGLRPLGLVLAGITWAFTVIGCAVVVATALLAPAPIVPSATLVLGEEPAGSVRNFAQE